MKPETVETLKEAVGCVAVFIIYVVLAWLFLTATPPQFSAERDLCAEQMEGIAK
ncbi:MAG: hypothetical protein ACI4Q3_00420 [Kiritimatiellia bacterium]